VWQGKGLRQAIFGCVATKGVAEEISDLWQRKELARMASRLAWNIEGWPAAADRSGKEFEATKDGSGRSGGEIREAGRG